MFSEWCGEDRFGVEGIWKVMVFRRAMAFTGRD
jgi:hypothetical protein